MKHIHHMYEQSYITKGEIENENYYSQKENDPVHISKCRLYFAYFHASQPNL